MADDLTLTIGGQALSGWTKVAVSVGIEDCPNHFQIELTEFYPGQATQVQIQAGSPCVVSLGSDKVITGYADVYLPAVDAEKHTVKIAGRGRCSDLVDCSAEWPKGQISGATALQIAQKLAQPYGITVSSTADPGPVIPVFQISITDTPWQIIEEVCRYAGLLAYETPDGNLVLAQAGSTKAASGFTLGDNVQAAAIEYSMAGRYSEVEAFLLSTNNLGPYSKGNLLDRETDPGVTRHRRLSIIAEAATGGNDIGKKRALWEIARRVGRSAKVSITADSWRDSAGKLWAPNTLAPLSLPQLKLDNISWCIGNVVYQRDEEKGTHADIMLMDPKAFVPEPIVLQPVVPGLKT